MRKVMPKNVALLLIVALLLASPAARAEEHFKRARQLYDEGDFTLSLVEFQRAYDISPNYRVLFNIGQVDIQLYNYAAARTALERYLRDGGGEIPEGRRAQVEQDLEMLRKRTAHLRIRTSPAGGDVAIDDVPVAPAALADEILVNAGRRKVVVTLAGHTPVTRIVTLAGGDHSELAIALAPLQVETAKPAVVTPPQAEEPKKSYTPAIVGWSTTAALAIGTGVVGGLYLSKQSDIDKLSDPARPVTKQEADDATAGADRLAVAADVLGLATLVTACISVYFTVKPPKSEPSGTRAASVRILPGGVGGTF
jgi:hypothetical protein